MYRLMKSKKFALGAVVSAVAPSYRQIQVDQFRQLDAALTACKVANHKAEVFHYVLDTSGKEYYEGAWID